MTTHIALLRAINLPGHNKASMADLRALLEGLGFEGVQSLLQSGNLVFQSSHRASAPLEPLLEKAAKKKLGLATDFMVRTASEWKTVIAGNPFAAEAKRDPGHLLVVFLKEPPAKRAVSALEAAIKGREVVRVKGRHGYVVYPDGVGRSKLTAALIDRKLETRGTGRNWNTVMKLAAAAGV